ncbi:MAG: hypothetical protein GY755_22495 [Chloroflexi bacterium]|nr:hypothetical protein [Chloroflexota bacterium]
MNDEFNNKKIKYLNDFKYTMNLQQYQSYLHLKRIQNDIENNQNSKYKLNGKLYGPIIENFTSIDPEYNIAIEALSGNKLFYYSVENEIVAKQLIKIMQNEKIMKIFGSTPEAIFDAIVHLHLIGI